MGGVVGAGVVAGGVVVAGVVISGVVSPGVVQSWSTNVSEGTGVVEPRLSVFSLPPSRITAAIRPTSTSARAQARPMSKGFFFIAYLSFIPGLPAGR